MEIIDGRGMGRGIRIWNGENRVFKDKFFFIYCFFIKVR